MTGAERSFSNDDFEIDDNDIIYHGESNSSLAKLSKIGTLNETFTLIKQWDSQNYQRDRITLSQDKIFWNHYLLDTDLNLIEKFYNLYGEEDILYASPSAQYAVGWRNIFNTDTQDIIKEIPAYYDVALFLSEKQLLLFNNENPISEEYKSTIYLYDFK